jgi:DNA-binding XRE family transcriptional regulator
MSKKPVTEPELATLAKKFRVAAGKTRAQAARELGVSRPSVFNAEENPDASLFKLRKKIIEKYSSLKVEGPEYRLIDESEL